MTWEIFMGLAAFSAFLIPLLGIAVRITRSLTSVQVALDNTAKNLGELNTRNEREHELLRERMEALEISRK